MCSPTRGIGLIEGSSPSRTTGEGSAVSGPTGDGVSRRRSQGRSCSRSTTSCTVRSLAFAMSARSSRSVAFQPPADGDDPIRKTCAAPNSRREGGCDGRCTRQAPTRIRTELRTFSQPAAIGAPRAVVSRKTTRRPTPQGVLFFALHDPIEAEDTAYSLPFSAVGTTGGHLHLPGAKSAPDSG